MSIVSMPRSTAENAYDLLSDVITVIREEPRRMDMGYWKLEGGQLRSILESRAELDRENGRRRKPQEAPPCGTVGCIAGWLSILKPNPNPYQETSSVGQDLLGDCEQANGERDQNYRSRVYEFFNTFPNGTPGTRAYVQKVIKHIKAFQATHKQRLLDTAVLDVGR